MYKYNFTIGNVNIYNYFNIYNKMYLNSQTDLVKRMIQEGDIVVNHTTKYLMSGNDIKMKN